MTNCLLTSLNEKRIVEHMSSNPFTRARLVAEAPSFTSLRSGGYTVSYKGHVLGTVVKSAAGIWISTHSDGTAGPGAWTRIDAAWALLNS